MRGEAGQGWGGAKQVRSKKSKLIPALSCGVGLKSRLILTPLPLRPQGGRSGVKLVWDEVERSRAKLSSLLEDVYL